MLLHLSCWAHADNTRAMLGIVTWSGTHALAIRRLSGYGAATAGARPTRPLHKHSLPRPSPCCLPSDDGTPSLYRCLVPLRLARQRELKHYALTERTQESSALRVCAKWLHRPGRCSIRDRFERSPQVATSAWSTCSPAASRSPAASLVRLPMLGQLMRGRREWGFKTPNSRDRRV